MSRIGPAWVRPLQVAVSLAFAAMGVFGLGGCSTPYANPLTVFSPYYVATQPEEYRSPPAHDPRYVEPPTYPSHLLKPVYKGKDDNNTQNRRPMLGGGSGAPMPGGF